MAFWRRKRSWCILLLPLAIGLTSLASAYPAATERFYSTGLYPLLTGLFGRIFSLVPFSAAQWLVTVGPLALIVWLIRQIVLAVRHREQRRDRLSRLVATVLCLAGLTYFVFTMICGLNYHREKFAVHSGLQVRPSSTQELVELSAELVAQASGLRNHMPEDEKGVVQSTLPRYSQVADIARQSYTLAAQEYPTLAGYIPRPKPVVLSRGMSYLDITGVYMPFSFEANVNVDTPFFWVPSTTAHELAHAKGYMREDEANFIAYITCRASENADFQYSGTLLALIHSTNKLYTADKEQYWAVMDCLSPGVQRDLRENSAYWSQFDTPVAQVSSAVNNAYLRTNRQSSGVRSYGEMVDLLLADYRQRHDLT